ncbi:putative thiol-disulfide oxidoreductase [Rhodococcus sp. AW25M09]|uniref:cytochrome c biogenesis CcdA family protein n=1 Tax=Rhodococcus sp. AW25M09 TaxID=1268303 RepID=UPI0002ACC67E|nr:cytochrome c biogenesis protein CcdA [Rhodococcus sp. AW25M09]CCQ14297.1 putative thiol-disulfide oxidoreductase [Rhodococcus sp. AW25M09]
MSQIGLLGAFLGGLLALLSPCSALLLPSFFAYAFGGVGTLAGRTGVFYVGLAAVLVPLGAGVGAIGSAITQYRGVTTMIGGVIIIGLGMMIIVGRGFALGSAQRAAASRDVSSIGSVFALGAVYGLAGFCSGPLLGAVLTVAVAGGQAFYGGILMALYAAGMVVPLFVLALVWDRFSLGSRTWLRGREIRVGPLKTHSTSLISGLIFVGIGVLFLLTEGTANLGGVMGVDSQYSLQVWISDVADTVPNAAVLLTGVLVVIVFLAVRILRGHSRNAQN